MARKASVDTLTRRDMASAIQRECGVTHLTALHLVEQILDEMLNAFERGETVKIPHFGTFNLQDKAARPGRNVKARTEVEVSARRVVKFGAAPALRKRIA